MSDSVGAQKENGVNFGNINALVIQIYNKDKADFAGDQTLSGFISFLIAEFAVRDMQGCPSMRNIPP